MTPSGFRKQPWERFTFFRFCRRCKKRFKPQAKHAKICKECHLPLRGYVKRIVREPLGKNSPMERLKIQDRSFPSNFHHKKPIGVALAGDST